MQNKSIAQLAADLRLRRYSSVELTRHYLDRIERHDPRLNSFVTVAAESALAAAERADQVLKSGDAGPLTGIPIAHKDIFCTKGIRTSCGSRMLDNFIAPYDATVVEKLAAAGAVVLGKTNMDEFAMGSSNETSFYGPVKNPWDAEPACPADPRAARPPPSPPGSARRRTGTDTGGSIRQPAAFCGITGIKPTYGRCLALGHDRLRLLARPSRRHGPLRRRRRLHPRRDGRLR